VTIVVAQQLIWYEATNENTGEVTGEILIEYQFDETEKVDGDIFDWGTFTIGTNRKDLNVTNIWETPIRVFLYYNNLPEDWTLTWAGNNTLLDTTDQILNSLTLLIPETTAPGTYNFNTIIYAEAI